MNYDDLMLLADYSLCFPQMGSVVCVGIILGQDKLNWGQFVLTACFVYSLVTSRG